MTERPILFSGAMVRAILEGRKTVTRRVASTQPADGWAFDGEYGRITSAHRHKGKFGAFVRRGVGTDFPEIDLVPCPYGQPGDRLWVRETWARVGNTDPGYLVYRATYPSCLPSGLERVPADIRDAGYRWRPSIHMPRANSRILLEITAVRVERLQDISEQQAGAEGIQHDHRMWFATDEGGPAFTWPQHAFEHLWRKINGAESWEANPWVWVVEFKRVTP